ncbi:MAG: phage tail protein [Thermosynechococcaceae cyanobacterium]
MFRKPDVLSSSAFSVTLQLEGSNSTDGYFLECQGLSHTQEVIEFCEVTPTKWAAASKGKVVRTKLPSNSKNGNITLRRGLIKSMAIWDWFTAIEEGNWAQKRRNCSLEFYNGQRTAHAKIELEAAWPTSYSIGDVSSGSSEITIEEIEIAFEGFKRIQAGGVTDWAEGQARGVIYG